MNPNALAYANACEYNRKARALKLALDGATSLETTQEQRMASFEVALNVHPQGSFDYNRLIQHEVALYTEYVIYNAKRGA